MRLRTTDATFAVLLQRRQTGRAAAGVGTIDRPFIAASVTPIRTAPRFDRRSAERPDADFILSMKGIVKRYAVTPPRQRRWALDIVHRLLLLKRESTKDRGPALHALIGGPLAGTP